MAIASCDLPTIATRLNEVLTLSVRVRTPEKLFGWEKQLETIQLALHSPGRHVFIYGDRGVGKTSLAQPLRLSSLRIIVLLPSVVIMTRPWKQSSNRLLAKE